MPDHAAPPWLYLASQSPRRRQLLDQLGVSHHLLLPDAHEDAEALEAERVGESPEDYVQRVTFASILWPLAYFSGVSLGAASKVLCNQKRSTSPPTRRSIFPLANHLARFSDSVR